MHVFGLEPTLLYNFAMTLHVCFIGGKTAFTNQAVSFSHIYQILADTQIPKESGQRFFLLIPSRGWPIVPLWGIPINPGLAARCGAPRCAVYLPLVA